MPHAGGGGGSGGGGFHSGSSSSAPKFDNYGNRHSNYYIRPGYYYNGTYVSLEKKERKKILITPIIFIIVSIFSSLLLGFSINNVSYDEGKLEDYGIKKYEEVYKSSSKDYEKNLLINIITYEDGKQFDYITIVGDDVDLSIDLLFGNENTFFGSLVLANVLLDNNFNNLYYELSQAIDALSDTLSKQYVNIQKNIQIKNTSSFVFSSGDTELCSSLDRFYEITGYNLSVYVSNNTDAYKTNLNDVIPGLIFCLIFLGFAVFILVKLAKAIKTINQSEKDGTIKKYYEGEDTYEEYLGNKNNQEDNINNKNNKNNKNNNNNDSTDPYNWKDDF